ncbi:MAG TPA: DUF4397 domain-containing protein [Streptosporangiaceae bacterium]|nr:DUF4397 domain-containing protein [Streptosporangiaceae bacterium]HME64327.1 DUF4397 domain-containing protein [Streptosporangiaceae bacterium]
MNFRRITRRLLMLLAASGLLLGIPAAATAFASSATSGTGWIRLAHLSPNTPAVDVYLYSFDNSKAMIVLHHVAYGTVSPYESVQAGDYSVAMRAAGASATSQPVLSTSVTIAAGHAYTVAGMGPESGLRLQVLDDDLTTPSGQALVRVIQASLKQQEVKVTIGSTVLAGSLKFASVSAYQAVTPGTETVTVSAVSAGAGDANSSVTLAAGTVHTLVVLDGASGLEVVSLEDASGSGKPPLGGVQTGFGGTAPHGPGSPVPWLVAIGAGSLLALTGGLRLRRNRQLTVRI